MIIVPKGFLGANEHDTFLDTFLRKFSKKHEEHNGQCAEKYGVYFKSEDITMHPYCWCEIRIVLIVIISMMKRIILEYRLKR